MKYIQFFCLVSTIVFCSCRFASINKLEEAFTTAGDNAIELEKVITHFSKDKRLSQYLDAAKYIVENIPGHISMDDANYLAYSKQLKAMTMPIEIDELNKVWTGADIHYSHDVNQVESKFLIQDIEDAFRIRDSVPWGRTIPFDVFKEYVLPYKVRQEALVPGWRITLYNKYKHVVQGIADPKEAFATLLNYLKEHTRKTNFNFSGDVDPLTMDHIRMGACSHLSVYYVAVLRALGLPAAYEYIDRWGNFSVNGHSWISYIGEKERTYTIANGDSVLRTMNPIDASMFKEHYDPHHEDFNISRWKKVYKIYRYTYQLLLNDQYAHLEQSGTHKKDVSPYYGLNGTIDLNASGYAYASLSFFKTGEDWQEFVFAKTGGGTVSFDGLADSIVYLPTFYKNGQKKEIGRPFYIDYDNKIVWLAPHLSDTDTLILRRKYPLFGHWPAMWRQMKGVKIEVSDTEDFRNPTNIHTIKETPMGLLSFEAKPAIMARYVRYICPPESRTAVAEFKFFDEQDEEISIAEAMGYGIKDTVSLAFDKNGLTSVSTKAGEAWIGARLEEAAKRIARVEILPKNDGNFIDAGDRYHLYYFDSEWISLGEQVAASNLLTYKNAPRGALFLLKNLSKGREERVFTMEEGRQVWW
ncbi:transglutaminase-like domain-containing protein [Sphingobacterium sp. FBM7-1]|uniref:transglutaminase-like domain-containing protein n=1 Tax=Sphingobacterium sp. FBM7-1 TaxID=2886688 RepID=UPI001D123920|nr:transglutaminase-like domain-containing protein [Sphingobacterium sp. FBM7-1]MCC2599283.1 transglutaminase-like domain-containing protein [Sphingobacterium sp. FBM7-1]